MSSPKILLNTSAVLMASLIFSVPQIALARDYSSRPFNSANHSTTSNQTANAARLAREAITLQSNIKTALVNLTTSDTNLKAKLAKAPAGVDTSVAQSAITDLESQISTLQNIQVPTAPGSEADLTPLRTTFQTAREAAQKDIMAANKAMSSFTQIVNFKNRADKAIADRITSLNQRITKINALKNLTASQKSGFVSQFQSRIDALNALKTKIDSESDSATLKADYESIFSDYRIFAIFEPEMNIMVQADTTVARANVLLAKTSNANAQAKLNDAVTQANSAVSTVSALTPANYPATQIFVSARAFLKAANADIASARQLMNQK